MIQNLLIDLDGTLVNSYESILRIEFIARFLTWWKPFGNPFRILMAMRQMEIALKRSDQTEVRNDLRAIKALAAALQISEETTEAHLHRTVRDIFPRLEKYFYPVPGAAPFIEWARPQYCLYLATNPVWTPDIVELRVKWAGIGMDSFKTATHAQKMTSCKPHKSYFQQLLEQEKLDPKTCLFVGNDPSKDGPAALLGMPVFILSKKDRLAPLSKSGLPHGFLWTGSYEVLKTTLENGALDRS